MGMVRVCGSRVRPPRGGIVGFIGLFVAATCAPGTAAGQVDPNSGIDFVTVGAPGNPAYMGSGIPGDLSIGRGAVNYEFRIGRMEVTTAQWVEFFNAAYDRPASERLPHLLPPDVWGAVPTTPNTPGGQRWRVPAGNENRLVGNISWRMAAMLCNWYHNNKSTDRAAFLSGAYDVSTFGFTGPANNIFTDQAERSPGARYFIPTYDEWMKAAHYDPNRNGPNQGGWWRYSISSDTLPVYGPPGATVNGLATQANALGFGGPIPPEEVLLGAYPNAVSPWGLLDVAGGTSEWTESIRTTSAGTRFRLFDGSSFLRSFTPSSSADSIAIRGGEYPDLSLFDYGFRIASVVPAPSAASIVAALLLANRRRRGDSSRGSVRSARG